MLNKQVLQILHFNTTIHGIFSFHVFIKKMRVQIKAFTNRLQGIHIGCSFKFILKVTDCERSTDYRSRISCLNLTYFFALVVFLLRKLTSGAFTIDSSTPTLRINLNEHRILIINGG
jgi:hypothetical protein